MKPLRRTVRTARTREDYELFRVSMPSFDPETVRQIIMMCQPGHYLKPDQPFASLFFHFSAIRALGLDTQREQGGFGQLLSTHISGTIERFGSGFEKDGDAFASVQGLKKGSLELLYLRECQHFLQKQSMDNGNNKVNFNQPPGKRCRLCGKEVWIYTSPDQEVITTENLLRANNTLQLRDLTQLQWTIIVNEQFTPTTVIAKVNQTELYYPILGKATYLLGEGEKPGPSTPIMKVRKVHCYHERILERRCQFCLQLIEQEQLQEFNRYLFQYNSKGISHGFTKGAALLQQEQQFISGLIAKKKLILILDLDNTILHSTEMSQLELAKVLKMRQYFMIPKLEFNSQGKLIRDYVMVKIRPYFREFLFVVCKLFEVYVYTKGTRLYADEICKWIRYQWGNSGDIPFDFPTWTSPRFKLIQNCQSFLPYRVLSRNEDASLETKSMQNILPNRTEYHIILDDRRDVWANSPSWYYTREYFYFAKRLRANNEEPDVSHYLQSQETAHPFKEKLIDYYQKMRQDYPAKKQYVVQFSEKADNFLLFAAHSLRKMHGYFFQHLKQKSQEKDGKKPKKHPVQLSNIMQRLKLFLSAKKCRFFLAPDEKGVNMMNIIHRAQKMGAIVLDEKSEELPDIIFRGNNYIRYIRNYYEKKGEPCPEINRPLDEKLEKLVTEPAVFTLYLQEEEQQVFKKEVISAYKEIYVKQEEKEFIEPKIIISPPPEQKPLPASKGSNFSDPEMVKQEVIPGQKANPVKQEEMDIEPTITILPPSQTVSSPVTKEQPLPVPVLQPQKTRKHELNRDFKAELQQLKKLSRKNIPVISQTYILACYEFSYRFRAEDFRLQNPIKEQVTHEDFNQIIDRAAQKIRVGIQDEMKQEIKASKMGVNSKGQNEKHIIDFPRQEIKEKGSQNKQVDDPSNKESSPKESQT